MKAKNKQANEQTTEWPGGPELSRREVWRTPGAIATWYVLDTNTHTEAHTHASESHFDIIKQ